MQRKPLFIVAIIVELLRFFALAFLAVASAALRPSGSGAWLYRYLTVPQLLFAVAFFLLWLDRSRYEACRPLALAGKVVSLAAWLPLALSLLGGGQDPRLLGRSGLGALLAVVAADLVSTWILVSSRPSREGGVGQGGVGPAGDPASIGPRGPEDIESVEG